MDLIERIRRKIEDKDEGFNEDFKYFIKSLDEYNKEYFSAMQNNNFPKVAYLVKNRNLILKFSSIKDRKRRKK